MSEQMQEKGRTRIASVEKALSILDMFVEQRVLNVTAISRGLNLSFATAHHLVSTLWGCGYLERDNNTKRYKLGRKALQLGLAAEESFELIERSRPVLLGLAARANESANIAILDGSEIVYVGQAPSSAPIRMFTRLGARAPLHCTGVGKVLLAAMPEDKAQTLAAACGYERFTQTTIVEWSALRRELEQIRERGYGIDREEREQGVACIAAPVRNARRETCAALSISGPAGRIVQRAEELASEVVCAAERLSRDLGFLRQ